MKRKNLLKTLALTLSLASVVAVGASAAGQPHWKLNNNNWYYYDGNGKIKTGWIYDKGNWYYCYSNGVMAKNTTIDGYYLNSNGAWSLNRQSTSDNSLTADDIDANFPLRNDISKAQDDFATDDILNNGRTNIILNSENELMLQSLTTDLTQGRNTLANARSKCIGKIVNNKYRIKNIILLKKVFPTSNGVFVNDKVNTIKSSELYSYTPSTTYKYDKFSIFTCSADRSKEWEAMRVVIELEAV